jgi:DNA topoisomerase-3
LAPKYSLGTPATQAGILDELITKRKYIEVKGKKRELYPTDAGRITVDFWQGTTLTDLKSAKAWQDVFKRVEKGDIQAEAYLKKIEQLLTNQVEVYRTKQPEISIAPPEQADYATQLFMPELVCPKCHKGKVGLVTRTANSGTKEWYGCDNPKCKFSLPKVFFSQALDEPLIRELCQLGKTKVFADLVDSKQRHYRNKVYFQLEPKSKKLTPKFT